MATQIGYVLLLLAALALPCGCVFAQPGHDAPTVLVLRAVGEGFEQTLKGLRDDVGSEVELVEVVVGANATGSRMAAAITAHRPKAIVLLGNAPIVHYKAYQQAASTKEFPPSLALSALYVDNLVADLANATGIRYEIPAVTSLVQLRALSEGPIRKVGVLYREWMEEYFEANRAFAAEEGFELVGIRLPNRVTFEQLNYHLRHLVRGGIDALWVINDNALLTERLLQNAWLPAVRRFDKPVIVGVDTLAGSELGFGTFSVSPDHYALGVQAADKLLRIKEDGWRIGDGRIEEPVSTTKLLNLDLSREKHIAINLTRLGEVDRVIE